ncbi:cytochrome aa3 quinol oxidase subunit IV [Aneurinibacillus aneurinilyticus]|jgi:cytochrome aa3-600 menaquinol oxidase subunit 4|uniref:Quinol oxidase subunit 4 n=2 Tax=Aneurinibacillus aneurinilyticus TaxID=1391 RepID=A0A848CZF4_ANEAE|nr:cytochrome aa3 quinol oxidase subunit IV [Aneurinibacillus aneurinilyticus]ERI09074.1 cytochrome aa3 quinol oxidase, subunit IV [Aneurinibacillus aneurinilyticus ATCC 12856]MCI1693344.1 cytochrome aa3 quinol oxidase subunit IV [Aneurinibacillus aneurinilyticus]MED0671420.1 cytochrome aa3 quinol oxidase subunit IV [Aneurinibacillus aneurinilyticus]MED0707522.1 cytochrome aa3 quinol oxidase subunit IV [Aneurinibacillus aneurinilyticus]MED0723890.1 cytochrome aa3 quinol oxidase subunit IV [Ane
MASHNDNGEQYVEEHDHHGFPWSHVIGFILSLVLTGAAFWAMLVSGLSVNVAIGVSLVLAILQVFVQLYMFMHIRESKSAIFQKGGIYFGLFVAFTVVFGSIFVMWYVLMNHTY